MLLPLAAIRYQLGKHCQGRMPKCCQSSLMCPRIYCYATQQSSATLGLQQHTEAAHFSRGKKTPINIYTACLLLWILSCKLQRFTYHFLGTWTLLPHNLTLVSSLTFALPFHNLKTKVRPAFISLISNMLDVSYLNFFTWAVSGRKGAKHIYLPFAHDQET